jgi:hypothetical protein
LIAALLLVDGALLGILALREYTSHRSDSAISIGPGPIELSSNDPRVARVFGALESEGLAAALDSLEQAATKDTALLRGGHQLAHELGRRALARSGGDAGVIGHCRPIFASGCYHGVVEGSVQARGGMDAPELERMCAAVGSPERPGPVYECVHGLGHGLLGAARFDATLALGQCDRLSHPRFAASCHEGVFMEAIGAAFAEGRSGGHSDHGTHHRSLPGRLALVPDDPYSPCDAISDPYAESCWLFQGFVILRYAGFEAAAALRTCDAAPDGRAARCYESVGHQLTGLFQRDAAWIIEQCGKGRPEQASHCAAGATLALNGMDWSGNRAARFCGAVPKPWKERCYGTAASSLASLAPAAQRVLLCRRVEREYAAICRQAAAVERGA